MAILAKIGAILPWVGDPLTLPMVTLPHWYRAAGRVNVWKQGREDTEVIEADQTHRREVEEMRHKARKLRALHGLNHGT